MDAEAAESKGEERERGKGVEQNGINTMQCRFEDTDQFHCFLFKEDSLKVVQLSAKI